MQSITKIIQENGGLEALERGDVLCVRNPGRHTLEIEYIGPGPGGGSGLVVSAHQPASGGIIRALELGVEVHVDGWLPYFFRDEETGEDLTVYTVSGKQRLVGINLELRRLLLHRMAEWDRRLLAEGYVEADSEARYWPLFPKAAGGEQ